MTDMLLWLKYRQLLLAKAVCAKVGRWSIAFGYRLLAIYKRPGGVALTGIVFLLLIKTLRLFDLCFECGEFCHRRIALVLERRDLLARCDCLDAVLEEK